LPTLSITTPLTDGAGTAGDADAILNKNELDAVPTGGSFVLQGATDAELGQTVGVQFNSKSYSASVVAATAPATGRVWTLNVPKADMAALAHGNSYSVTANVDDTAGNPAPASVLTLQVRLAPPDVPTVQTLNTNNKHRRATLIQQLTAARCPRRPRRLRSARTSLAQARLSTRADWPPCSRWPRRNTRLVSATPKAPSFK
jgi:hypothetical protein